MKKVLKDNKGYMLIEVVVSSVIALVMAYFLMDITLKLVNKNNDYYVNSVLLADKNIITKEIMDDINSKKLVKIVKDATGNKVTLTFDEGTEKELTIDSNTISYGNYKKKLSSDLNLGTITIDVTITNANKPVEGILTLSIPAYTNYSKEDYGVRITVPYSEDIVIVNPKVIKKDESGANHPKLVASLIPVKYNGSTWVTADYWNTDYDWYNYNDKKWANAVLVNDTLRSKLTTDSSGNYTPGQVIGDTESEGVLAFYVWIPRYKYKVWNINKTEKKETYSARTKGIDIVFEKEKDVTGGLTCTYDFSKTTTSYGGVNETCEGDGEYYTHPAFTFGNDDLTGFWMGKFEISSTDQTIENYGGGDSTSLSPQILPNVLSWRKNSLTNFWKVIKNMQKSGNGYGLSASTGNVDTHMITNMEWGAVTYLTNSKYGRCTGTNCTEVTQNKNGSGLYHDTYTGYGSSSSYKYTTVNGQLASTTGNIYGVYDMSGGALEFVMANGSYKQGEYMYSKGDAGDKYSYSGYEKYLTTYAYSTSSNEQTAANKTRLGDALGEILYEISTYHPAASTGWYGDNWRIMYGNTSHVDSDSTLFWLVRGGSYRSTNSGIFWVDNSSGSSSPDTGAEYTSTRAILTVY